MSTRGSSSGLLVAFAFGTLVVCSSSVAVVACSSSDTGATGDGSNEAGPDARTVVEAGPDTAVKQTPEQCEADCATKFASAAPKSEALDTCWAAHCQAPCVDDPPGTFDAGSADAGADDSGTICGTDYASASGKSCDDCTTVFCCPSWSGCFNSTDCIAYDDCVAACYPDP